ncbi:MULTISPECIES: chitin disaccharide deacetylase [Providencia]|uniref:Chitin disaccharide deacetylase n=2 Tax=Providencia TaxID=586 RepID=A0ABD5L152_PROST|nr:MULTISPECIES: chitin disaccharide deacetylase [Providencia]ELR5045768.1 chitin disaccharide deacetylase [Providencia rettgeri]ELR5120857.1 chitin disaccharide deacetylase [Providencia stuartii]ELR5291228.1 chitin disaccharide deacetylase [Providencia stuartii]MCR4180316.1 chitin disaccharide deacetylase [Providencia vermicola]URE77914.1 chitin disaccharide deacetylase [Providencia stuartii]
MTPLLIVNADDFGLCKSVNYGIVEAHHHGIVLSTTAMVNMPDVHHAAKLAADLPTLTVGMHFVLTAGMPFTPMPSLVRQGILGKWLWEIEKRGQLPIEEIVQELHFQYDQFCEIFGHPPSHIDGHHHVQMIPTLFPRIVEFANKKGVAVRVVRDGNIDDKTTHIARTTDYFSAEFYGEPHSISESLFLNILDTAKQRGDSSLEIMCHPAFLGKELLKSRYAYPRLKELEILTSKRLKETITEKGFLLGSYLDL